jgi:hypothetical protein
MIVYSSLGSWGRCGNMMFQIASTIGIAEKNNLPYAFPKWQYSNTFAGHFPEMPKVKYEVYHEPHFHYADVSVTGNTDLRGYFQSEKYFSHCEKKIRRLFTFKDEHPLIHAVAVHVRRGDYLRQPEHHPVQLMSYYREAMDKFKGQRFIIFSDDIDWCKTQAWGHEVYFSEGKSETQDLNIMSRCENFIISNSSYSYWGAWLSDNEDKTVIAPKGWFGSALKHDTKDLLPKEWITI